MIINSLLKRYYPQFNSAKRSNTLKFVVFSIYSFVRIYFVNILPSLHLSIDLSLNYSLSNTFLSHSYLSFHCQDCLNCATKKKHCYVSYPHLQPLKFFRMLHTFSNEFFFSRIFQMTNKEQSFHRDFPHQGHLI